MTDLGIIGERIATQDNRITNHPAFCVQGLRRLGPMMPEYADGPLMYHDWSRTETYYADGPDPERWTELNNKNDEGDLPNDVTAGGYIDVWETVQVCFTQAGCEEYLQIDGHNVRRKYHDVRIYAASFYRNDEMISIRAALMNMRKKQS